MPYSLVAWSQSEDEAGVYAVKDAVADPIVTVSGDIIYVPEKLTKLLGAYAAVGGTVEGGAYLISPSLRRFGRYELIPVQEGIKPSGDESVRIHPDLPVGLDPYEGLEAYVKSNPGSAEVHTVVAFLGEAALAPVKGEIIQVGFTTAITETVSVWTNGAITMRVTLPVGVYAIIGAAMWGTSGVAFRFNFVDLPQRPGFICNSSEGNHGNPFQRHGHMGEWGRFHSLTPPSVDWLAAATSGSAQGGILDLLKVA